ncbi:hypothetical protein CYMTET_18158, partial [Cymbomonas tetramitiformis]
EGSRLAMGAPGSMLPFRSHSAEPAFGPTGVEDSELHQAQVEALEGELYKLRMQASEVAARLPREAAAGTALPRYPLPATPVWEPSMVPQPYTPLPFKPNPFAVYEPGPGEAPLLGAGRAAPQRAGTPTFITRVDLPNSSQHRVQPSSAPHALHSHGLMEMMPPLELHRVRTPPTTAPSEIFPTSMTPAASAAAASLEFPQPPNPIILNTDVPESERGVEEYLERYKRIHQVPKAAVVIQSHWRKRGYAIFFQRYLHMVQANRRKHFATVFYGWLGAVQSNSHWRVRLLETAFFAWRGYNADLFNFARELASKLSNSAARVNMPAIQIWRGCANNDNRDPSISSFLAQIALRQVPWRKQLYMLRLWRRTVVMQAANRIRACQIMHRMSAYKLSDAVQSFFRFWFRYTLVMIGEREGIPRPNFRPIMPKWDEWLWERKQNSAQVAQAVETNRINKLRKMFQAWHYITRAVCAMRRAWAQVADELNEKLMRKKWMYWRGQTLLARYYKNLQRSVVDYLTLLMNRNRRIRQIKKNLAHMLEISMKEHVIMKFKENVRYYKVIKVAGIVKLLANTNMVQLVIYAWMSDFDLMWMMLIWIRWSKRAKRRVNVQSYIIVHLLQRPFVLMGWCFDKLREAKEQAKDRLRTGEPEPAENVSDLDLFPVYGREPLVGMWRPRRSQSELLEEKAGKKVVKFKVVQSRIRALLQKCNNPLVWKWKREDNSNPLDSDIEPLLPLEEEQAASALCLEAWPQRKDLMPAWQHGMGDITLWRKMVGVAMHSTRALLQKMPRHWGRPNVKKSQDVRMDDQLCKAEEILHAKINAILRVGSESTDYILKEVKVQKLVKAGFLLGDALAAIMLPVVCHDLTRFRRHVIFRRRRDKTLSASLQLRHLAMELNKSCPKFTVEPYKSRSALFISVDVGLQQQCAPETGRVTQLGMVLQPANRVEFVWCLARLTCDFA